MTVEAEEVIVYVDEHDHPMSTTTVWGNQAAPTPSSTHTPTTFATTTSPPANYQPQQSTTTPVAPPPSSTSVPAPYPPQQASPSSAPAPSSSTSVAPASSSSSVTSGQSSSSGPGTGSSSSSSSGSGQYGFGKAITYSPYTDNGFCKTQAQVSQDLEPLDYDVIRLYGTDCNQTKFVLEATKGKNTKVFAGIFDIHQIPLEVSQLSSDLNGDWTQIHTVGVGNELVNDKKASVGDVVGAIGQARTALSGAGYHGAIVTVDTYVAMNASIELCKNSDYCAVNCHAFFDGNTLPEHAGTFVKGWADTISKSAGKQTIITETGWPTQGQPNGIALPSKDDQQKAVDSINAALPSNKILFNAYNDFWKNDTQYTFEAEHYWGIMGNAPCQPNGK